jgi:hypothetical protein
VDRSRRGICRNDKFHGLDSRDFVDKAAEARFSVRWLVNQATGPSLRVADVSLIVRISSMSSLLHHQF